jgi:hypothetical protein
MKERPHKKDAAPGGGDTAASAQHKHVICHNIKM